MTRAGEALSTKPVLDGFDSHANPLTPMVLRARALEYSKNCGQPEDRFSGGLATNTIPFAPPLCVEVVARVSRSMSPVSFELTPAGNATSAKWRRHSCLYA